MATVSIRVTVDQSVNAAYIALSDNEVESTVDLGDGILIDLDDMRVVVGIEVLNLDAQLPLARLRDEFHVHSSVVNHLDLLRPTIRYQLNRIQQGAEGTTVAAASRLVSA